MVSRHLQVLGLVLTIFVTACSHEEAGVADVPDSPADLGKADGISSESPSHLVDIPFYFGVPKRAISVTLNRAAYPYPTVWNTTMESEEVGLRMIAVNQVSATVQAKQSARREMAHKLAAAGVLQDGDVVLSFRPHLADTMPYPHIQMGTTHAGLVYTKDGAAYNIDSPLDTNYVGQFDAPHYAGNGTTDGGTDALHIVRPRMIDEARRAKLRDWVERLLRNLGRINGEREQLKFQSDYMKPIFVATGLTTRQTVTRLGLIILEQDMTTKLPMYCAEFVWHMLALSNCTPDEIRRAPAEGASCVDPPFEPMPLVSDTVDGLPGLAEGPLLALFEAPAEDRLTLAASVFHQGNAAKLSSGHRAVAEAVAPLMDGVAQYYKARIMGAPEATIAEAAGRLNGAVAPNYSPTAFLVNAMTDTRTLDYVTTIVFVNATGYAKAKTLARNPVP